MSTFEDILSTRLSRRRVMVGSLGAAVLAACATEEPAPPEAPALPPVTPPPPPPGTVPTSTATPPEDKPPPKPLALGFSAVAKSLADALILPAGYAATVLYRLGDPLVAALGPAANDGTDDAASFAQRAGDHHDGMYYFGLGSNGKKDDKRSDRALLVMNHEAITPAYLHANGPTIEGAGLSAVRSVADEVVKEIAAHGVSVIEIVKAGGRWSYVKGSTFNRRITAATPIRLSGPAAGSSAMITRFSTTGTMTRGTVNNCACGHTPWGTYLTCEENWAGYFRRTSVDDARRTAKELASFARYGVAGAGRELWATAAPDTSDDAFGRWNAELLGSSTDGSDDYRNAPNTFGWVVEIDPFMPASVPRKRTALGRMAHEGCWLGPVVPGKPLVWYMGCDGRNEYIYKFVSKKPWDAADATGGLLAGDKYLDDGTLYAAKFDPDGTGEWLELRFGVGSIGPSSSAYAFDDQADVLINARLAADAAGATKMDRPEWGAVNPVNGEVYFTLTNTNASSRPLAAVSAANPRFYDDPKGSSATPQRGNPNGHVIRIAPSGSDGAAKTFRWDVYLFGARSTSSPSNVNLSGLVADNDFSSPDGCWFSQATPGLLWIQTDDGAYTDVTNCMMLAAIPGKVGDGAKRTITSKDGDATKAVDTFVGRAASTTNLRRFLVGPKECEITGIAESPDGKTLFVNIQHPGEDTKPTHGDPSSYGSHWPDGGTSRPRSATIAITRIDGGVVATS
ncbi:MAG: PhoX family phosphatase [Deltaproteobacteria bacterium]|nr:PhoX family phosphatase [Deltaproteobacteria bacterium]